VATTLVAYQKARDRLTLLAQAAEAGRRAPAWRAGGSRAG
jgi:hypothetical protein